MSFNCDICKKKFEFGQEFYQFRLDIVTLNQRGETIDIGGKKNICQDCVNDGKLMEAIKNFDKWK
jgi:hypothetical protein